MLHHKQSNLTTEETIDVKEYALTDRGGGRLAVLFRCRPGQAWREEELRGSRNANAEAGAGNERTDLPGWHLDKRRELRSQPVHAIRGHGHGNQHGALRPRWFLGDH